MNKKRINYILINPTEEEIFEREPLLKFSFYLSDKNNLLLSTSDEILNYLDSGFNILKMNTQLIGKASSLLWFWTLGAYEIVRTIIQAEDCFSKKFIVELKALKKELSKARMPSAKMEKQGKNEPINSNRSADGWDFEKKDLLIGDPNDFVSGRDLLNLYDKTITSLKPNDILKRHEESRYYKKAKDK